MFGAFKKSESKVDKQIKKLIKENEYNQDAVLYQGKVIKILLNKRDASRLVGGAGSKILVSVDNVPYIVKDEGMTDSYNEFVASHLGKALGYSINDVFIADIGHCLDLNNNIISFTKWEYGFKTINNSTNFIDKNLRFHTANENDLNFFDYLIDNEDRHSGNWGYLNEEMFIIDNGCSYPSDRFITTNRDIHASVLFCSRNIVDNFLSLSEEEIISVCTPCNYEDMKDEFEIRNTFEELINLSVERFLIVQDRVKDVVAELEDNLEKAV